MDLYSRDGLRPSCANNLDPPRNQRVQGRPGGRLPPGPPRRKGCARRVDHRYRRRHSGLPCAVVYGLLRALLGEPGLFATVALLTAACRRPVGLTRVTQNLAPASGRRDHTTSPSALASLVLRAAGRSRKIRPAATRARDALASTALRPNVRDVRDTPLWRAGMAQVIINFGKNERKIFLMRGLDTPSPVDSAYEIDFCAHAIRKLFGELRRCGDVEKNKSVCLSGESIGAIGLAIPNTRCGAIARP